MTKPRRLGRGLEALLGRIPAVDDDATTREPHGGAAEEPYSPGKSIEAHAADGLAAPPGAERIDVRHGRAAVGPTHTDTIVAVQTSNFFDKIRLFDDIGPPRRDTNRYRLLARLARHKSEPGK